MIIDFILGILGVFLGFLTIRFLGNTKVTKVQKLFVYFLSSLTFVFYLIFGLFDLSTEIGPELNLGLFQISYGISESIINLMIIILPIVFGLCLVVTLKNFIWLKRFIIPTFLVIAIAGINFFQTYREYQQHHWDFEDSIYNNCLSLGCEE